MQQLGDEKVYLDTKLAEMTGKYAAERNRSSDLASRLESLERELWFKIKVLSGELEIEREKSLSQTKIDIVSGQNDVVFPCLGHLIIKINRELEMAF